LKVGLDWPPLNCSTVQRAAGVAVDVLLQPGAQGFGVEALALGYRLGAHHLFEHRVSCLIV
jgi:hypothetical protein